MKVLVLIVGGYLVGSAILCWCCCALAGAADRRASRLIRHKRTMAGELLTNEHQPKRSRFAAVQIFLSQSISRSHEASDPVADAGEHPKDSGVTTSE